MKIRPLRVYLETSVWNFCFADDAPEKRDATNLFFENVEANQLELFISDEVLLEIGRANPNKQLLLREKIQKHQPRILKLDSESRVTSGGGRGSIPPGADGAIGAFSPAGGFDIAISVAGVFE